MVNQEISRKVPGNINAFPDSFLQRHPGNTQDIPRIFPLIYPGNIHQARQVLYGVRQDLSYIQEITAAAPPYHWFRVNMTALVMVIDLLNNIPSLLEQGTTNYETF